MNDHVSIIAYRNPFEQWFWENIDIALPVVLGSLLVVGIGAYFWDRLSWWRRLRRRGKYSH